MSGVAQLLASGLIDVVLFDCDGVIWQGSHLLPGALQVITHVKSLNVHVKFITNNACSRARMHAKFVTLGMSDVVALEDCFPSSVAAAENCVARVDPVRSAYVIGGEGLLEELSARGIQCTSDGLKNMTEEQFVELANRSEEEEPFFDAVVMGWDTGFNYFKMCRASLAMQRNPRCVFVATNDDPTDRVGGTWLIPGNGSALASVKVATGREPVVCGKPNPLFAQIVLKSAGLEKIDPARVLMFGDRTDTDIRLAKNCGFRSCLLMSGVTQEDDVPKIAPELRADFICKGLSDIAKALS